MIKFLIIKCLVLVTTILYIFRYCPSAQYIIKMDDDVKSDLRHLLNKMATKYKGNPPPILGKRARLHRGP